MYEKEIAEMIRQRGADNMAVRIEIELECSHHNNCSCGGAGKEHPDACPACKMYHDFVEGITK